PHTTSPVSATLTLHDALPICMVSEERCQQVPYVTCRLVSQECVRQVPCTTCTMEPYCVTRKVCRQVPVCVPVCEPCCPPPLPSADRKSTRLNSSHQIISYDVF